MTMTGVVGDIFYFELTGRDRMQHDIKSTIHGLGKLRRENKCNLKQLKKDIKEHSNQDTCNNGMFTTVYNYGFIYLVDTFSFKCGNFSHISRKISIDAFAPKAHKGMG